MNCQRIRQYTVCKMKYKNALMWRFDHTCVNCVTKHSSFYTNLEWRQSYLVPIYMLAAIKQQCSDFIIWKQHKVIRTINICIQKTKERTIRNYYYLRHYNFLIRNPKVHTSLCTHCNCFNYYLIDSKIIFNLFL